MVEDNNIKNGEVIAEWSVHRSRQEPRKLSILIILLIVANVLLFFIFRKIYMTYPFFVILGNIILIGSISDFLFPIRFRLTIKGAESKNFLLKKQIAWEDVKNCYVAVEGIKLSPLTRLSRLENFRGLMLLFNNNKNEITEHVKRLATNRIK
jgi:hypothetical protein